jgi:ABC-2 type transport system permease protein
MTGIVFRRVLYDSRRTILGWGIGMAIYAMYVIIIFPSITGFTDFGTILDNPLMKALLGDLSIAEFMSADGLLGTFFFLFAPLVFAVLAVLYGLNMTATEEDRGTLDLLLSTPLPRWQLILEKFAALVVVLVAILVFVLVGFLLGLLLTPSVSLGLGDLLLGVLNVIPVVMLMAVMTLLLSTVLRSRGTAAGIVAAVVVASYFIFTLSDMMEPPASDIRYGSFFTYYGGSTVLVNGINWGNFLLLTALTVILLGVSLWTFQRRDIGT